MDLVNAALEKMNFDYQSADIIQRKDGVIVARVICENKHFILKLFQKQEFCREIEAYRILSSLHIPVLHLISATDNAFVIEDVCHSGRCRLGEKEDLEDPAAARLIAKWYRQLHQKGQSYLARNNHLPLYSENDTITPENIEEIKRKTNTASLPVWELIERNFNLIKGMPGRMKQTLTYNDFYYTNLIVAKDASSAMMFDYNLLGKGYAYADIRNVCSSLSEKAQKAFCEEYGPYNEAEKIVDDVVSVLTSAFRLSKKPFPAWANGIVSEIRADYIDKVTRLLCLAQSGSEQ